MNKLPTCCEFHGIDCTQGDVCPVRIARAAPQPEPDDLQVMALSLTETVLIALIVLACTGLCAYFVMSLALLLNA